MKKRYYLLASMFMLATLPLVAESSPCEGEEIALESQETAQFGNRKTVGTKQDHHRKKCMVECECKEPEVFVVPEEIAIESQRNTITPSVYPYISSGWNTYGTVAFLWWQPVIGNSGYAYTGTADGYHIPLGTSVHSGKLQRPAFGFEPGVKVAFGGHFDHDGWDLSAEYTYLPGSGDNCISESCSDGQNNSCCSSCTNFGSCDRGEKSRIAVTTGDGIVAPISLDEACCSWKQKFNVLNLTLGRNFFISKYLTLKPHVGMNSAWITETYKIGYVPTPNSNDPRDPDGIFLTNIINHIEVEQKQSLWGIGLRGGIDTMWHINRSFAFYGDLSLTTFWGRFHVRNSDVVSESVSGTYKTLNINYKVHTVIPVIETGFGLAYITWFNKDRLRLQVQLGWEHQIWTDFNYFTQGQGNGSLALQGMTLKGGLTF